MQHIWEAWEKERYQLPEDRLSESISKVIDQRISKHTKVISSDKILNSMRKTKA